MIAFTRALQKLSKVAPAEVAATSASFFLGLILMVSYYLLRPVRDAMSSQWSDAELSTLWTINFFFSFIVIAVYSFFASRAPLKKVAPGVYVFFSATFFLFYLAATLFPESGLTDKSFYVWVSVYSLLQMSVLWAFLATIFTTEQSKRLFGVITSGASVGAIVGPSVPLLFSDIGVQHLMLLASVCLLFALPLVAYLNRTYESTASTSNPASLKTIVGGNVLSGFKVFLRSRFLLAIGFFLFLYTGISSFVYFELKNLMVDMDFQRRTEIWAFIDLTTNTLTVLAGLLLTSRIATRFGIGVTLAIIPLVVVIALLSIVVFPMLAVVVGLQVVRRSGNYAITRPAREMLFTCVDREARYKAKQVVDVVVYRGGDVFWAWSFTLLTAGFGLGVAGVAGAGAAIAFVWAILGFYLGKEADKKRQVRRRD
ncbi:MFS transporter [Porticoccus sp. W117]|uniref:NTP/NDP exchange transporter n=1 Tax=Porticoccus sp. W117 TaxID=3054777 RepID=UPI00259740A3|nr:MFS transporter [Porticoccus sp. W117]MDM3871426.1 MFS transporter [Porticoccus sp. W117]